MTSKYKMIWQLMRGHRSLYAWAIAALIISSCFMYLVPLVPQTVMDGVLSENSDGVWALGQRAIELGGGREFLRAHLWIAGVCVLALMGLAGCFTYLRSRWAARASEAITRKVRDRLYDQLQHLPCLYHDRAETGDQVQRCTSDVETLRTFLATHVVEIGRAMIMMLVPIPLMLSLDVRMTLVSVVIIPPVVVFSYFFFKKVQASFKLVDEAEGRMTSTLQENLTGIRVVRAFARQEHEKERFEDKNSTHRDLDLRLYRLFAWYWSISDVLCMGQLALIVTVGGYWLATGQLLAGTFFFFLAAVNMYIWPVRQMGRVLAELGKALVAIGRIGEILNHPRETGPPSTRGIPLGSAAVGEVVFDRVSFSHGDAKVLDSVSFRVEPGQTLALLGPSGSGKSTIVNLLLRFYDPDEGTILLDGRGIVGIDRKEVRSKIAVVMQEPFLYSKTVQENIRLGRSGASKDKIMDAASTAGVHDAILEFDNGYDTLVGERGVTLSGGQRQRVALARAVLDRASVLVLDDAFSAVDTDTEMGILDALRRRNGSQTMLLIAHRLSTLMHADWILVLDHGRIIQQGTHEGLAAEDGLYRRLWKIQSSMEEDFTDNLRTVTTVADSRSLR